MKVLMVTGTLPSVREPWVQSFIKEQIDSLKPYCDVIHTFEIKGNRIFKHIDAILRLDSLNDDYDLIHAHYGIYGLDAHIGEYHTPLVVSLMGSDLLGTPSHDGKMIPYTRIEAALSRYLANACDAVIVKSEEMARVIPETRPYIIPNGVDTERYKPMNQSTARKTLNWSQDKTYILFPSDPARPEKNYPLAIAAVTELRRRLGSSFLLIPMRGIKPKLVPVYMNASDLILLTSLSEGSPNVIKEAMACNRPIVSVPVGDVEELISGVAGCYLSHPDPMKIADSITMSLMDDASDKTYGRDIIFRRHLTMTSVAERIYEVYKFVLEGKS